MRKSFEGLCGIVERGFEEEINPETYFVFLNKRRDRMKVLYWDVDGLAIWYKRLEKGTFGKGTETPLMSRRDFLMLLEGIEPKKLKKRFKFS